MYDAYSTGNSGAPGGESHEQKPVACTCSNGPLGTNENWFAVKVNWYADKDQHNVSNTTGIMTIHPDFLSDSDIFSSLSQPDAAKDAHAIRPITRVLRSCEGDARHGLSSTSSLVTPTRRSYISKS
jgi:hypothetical protein